MLCRSKASGRTLIASLSAVSNRVPGRRHRCLRKTNRRRVSIGQVGGTIINGTGQLFLRLIYCCWVEPTHFTRLPPSAPIISIAPAIRPITNSHIQSATSGSKKTVRDDVTYAAETLSETTNSWAYMLSHRMQETDPRSFHNRLL